jgi:hypothetical protein
MDNLDDLDLLCINLLFLCCHFFDNSKIELVSIKLSISSFEGLAVEFDCQHQPSQT